MAFINNMEVPMSDEQVEILQTMASDLEGVVLFQQVLMSDGTKSNRAIIDYPGDWPSGSAQAQEQ